MEKSLTILFPPFDGIGHVNASIGVAQVLQARGHRIVFAINEQWRGKLSAYGFEEELIPDPERDPTNDPASYWTEKFLNMGTLMPMEPIEKIKNIGDHFIIELVNKNKRNEALLMDIVNRNKPDVLIIDNFFIPPSILKSGIPWVLLWSSNPLRLLGNDNLPPCGSGFPSKINRKVWQEFKAQRNQIQSAGINLYNEWIVSNGLSKMPNDNTVLKSPYLNIYDYPEEIDYIETLPANFKRIDNFIRFEKNSNFKIPENLRNMSGKLIYLSLGSVGAGNVNLMKRLINILSKSSHKFIVSKGQLHDQYELAVNMWGEKTLPQTKVLPIVDLVITHGGNNSLTESFYFGKPMIVMPLLGDQYDNAQRVHETGYGIRLDPYTCAETELLDAIENLLNDRKLEIKMNEISKRIQSSNRLQRVVDLIEKLAKK